APWPWPLELGCLRESFRGGSSACAKLGGSSSRDCSLLTSRPRARSPSSIRYPAIPSLPGWADHLPATKTAVNIKRGRQIASTFYADLRRASIVMRAQQTVPRSHYIGEPSV